MKFNRIIIAFTGFMLIFSLIIKISIYEKPYNEQNESITDESSSAILKKLYNPQSSLPSEITEVESPLQFSFERASLIYPASNKSETGIMLNVEIINQYPELPVGCEITATTALLRYMGFDLSKSYLAEKYLNIFNDFYFDNENLVHAPHPAEAFIGDPFSWGYGCYAQVIVDAINKFIKDEKIYFKAYNLTGLDSSEFVKYLDVGVPIIIWASLDMKKLETSQAGSWLLNDTTERFFWNKNSHTLVLCGYDEKYFYLVDSNNKKDYAKIEKDLLIQRYKDNGMQAVVVG